jgi:hypothetical protein
MMIVYEKNSDGVVFKKLPDGSHKLANLNSGEYLAWILINGDPVLNTYLDSAII